MKDYRFKLLQGFLLVVIILGLGFLIRFYGVNYGLPNVFHPDETRIILDTLSMAQRYSILSSDVDYPLFFKYVLLLVYGAYYLAGRIIGIFTNPNDFASQFIINPSNIFLLSRLVNVVIGMLMGLVGYLLGRKFFNREVGLISMMFLLFEFQLVLHSQLALHQTFAAFATLPVFYCFFRLFRDDSLKSFLLAGVFLGLAFSIHHTSVFLLLVLFMVLGIHFLGKHKDHKTQFFIKRWLILFIMLGFCSILGNLNWIFLFNQSLQFFHRGLGASQVAFSSKQAFNYNPLSMFWWFVKEVIRQDLILGAFLIGGIVYSLCRRTKKDTIFLAFVGVYMFAYYNWAFRWLHVMIGLLPIMCIFGARFFYDILEKLNLRKLLVPIILLTIIPNLFSLITIDIRKNRPDTRQIAAKWTEENIPSGTKIGIDWSAYSVPVFSDIPIYMRNPIAQTYYEERIDNSIKEKYSEFLKSKIKYNIYDVMYSQKTPIWPDDMPEDVIKKAQGCPVCVDLYSYFNFRTLDELEREKVEYLIVSSYTYGMFLLNNDPNKSFLFNVYVKDDMRKYNSQADYYIDDDRHGLLFYVVKRGRDFYEPILNGTAPGVVLLKEIKPGTENFGPVIKIYKLSDRMKN